MLTKIIERVKLKRKNLNRKTEYAVVALPELREDLKSCFKSTKSNDVIARSKATKQSLLLAIRDCFAALAMTTLSLCPCEKRRNFQREAL